MSLTRTAKWLLGCALGLLSGVYRKGFYDVAPALRANQNENAHYLHSADDVARRLATIQDDPATSAKYPALYWLSHFSRANASCEVIDFGGSYGYDYFLFRRYLDPAVKWHVVEIPELVASASSYSTLSDVTFLDSSSEMRCDFLYSSATAMNAADAFFDFLDRSLPRACLVTSVECWEGPTFYSMQVVRAFGRRCIYTTFNRDEFIRRFTNLGYELKDSWTSGEQGSGVFLSSPLEILYHGFYFHRKEGV